MEIEKLTKRESEIAQAFAKGASHRGVAAQLGIAPTTVRTHLGTVYRKLGVRSKIELFHRLNGLSEAPDRPVQESARPAPSTARPFVVVLPFTNLSGQPEQDALITGLVDRLSGTLAHFSALRVISSASSLAYRDTQKNLSTIAQELSANYAVRGGFLRSGERVRVSTELTDAATGTLLWSRSFDGNWSDILDLQDELARAIASAIEPEIRVQETTKAQRQPEAVDAWTIYCRAYHAAFSFSAEGYDQAEAFCHEALSIDPTCGSAHALLGRIHFMRVILSLEQDPRRAIEKGIDHCQKALAIDERDEVAFGCLSCNLVMAGAFDDAFMALDRAMQINPNHPELYNARALANVFAKDGSFQQVISDSEYALKVSPNDPMRWTFLTNIGMAHLADDENGSLHDAQKAFRTAAAEPKASWIPFSGAAMAALAIGNTDEFETYLERARKVLPGLGHRDHLQAFGHLIERSSRMRHLVEGIGKAIT